MSARSTLINVLLRCITRSTSGWYRGDNSYAYLGLWELRGQSEEVPAVACQLFLEASKTQRIHQCKLDKIQIQAHIN